MKITPDTNVLVRVAVDVESEQAPLAVATLREASRIVVTLPALCEFVWVSGRGYKRSRAEIAASLRKLLAVPTVAIDRAAVEAGIAMLEAGGDFADRVIAFEGKRLGGEVFVSFDAKAVRKIRDAGAKAELLGS